jgi:hypothetical protein
MKIEQIVQETYEYNADNIQTMRQMKLVEKREYGECVEAGCAVWRDGRCTYNDYVVIKKEG